MITLLGESFFLNRMIGDEFSTIQYIVLGSSPHRPTKKDLQLGNELIRKKCVKSFDLDKKTIKLSASFTASELEGINEIGAHTGEILISHDVFDENTIEDLLTPTVGDITIDYYIELASGSIRKTEWESVDGKNNVFYLIETNEIAGVMEANTNSGYRRVNSVDDVVKNKGTYYHDDATKNLYVHTTYDTSPTNEEIIILTR